jgi:hypothetical protein
VADAVELIDRDAVPDVPDRVIAATALSAGVALVSRDGKIRASQVQTVWQHFAITNPLRRDPPRPAAEMKEPGRQCPKTDEPRMRRPCFRGFPVPGLRSRGFTGAEAAVTPVLAAVDVYVLAETGSSL